MNLYKEHKLTYRAIYICIFIYFRISHYFSFLTSRIFRFSTINSAGKIIFLSFHIYVFKCNTSKWAETQYLPNPFILSLFFIWYVTLFAEKFYFLRFQDLYGLYLCYEFSKHSSNKARVCSTPIGGMWACNAFCSYTEYRYLSISWVFVNKCRTEFSIFFRGLLRWVEQQIFIDVLDGCGVFIFSRAVKEWFFFDSSTLKF